jgi:hypothetical protein
MWHPIDRPGQAGPAPALCVVAGETWHASVAGGQFDFFTTLAATATAAGLRSCLAADAPGLAARLAARGHAVILIGPRQPVGPGILHAHPAYVRGFWYLDPLGVHHAASLATAPFDAARVPNADWFFNGVAGWMTRGNISKFDQPPRAPLPPVAAAFFAQEIEGWKSPVHHLTTAEILSVLGRAGRPALVKPHPAMSAAGLADLRRAMAPWPNLTETKASVHDIAAAAGVVVTQTSAAGFEALMQGARVVTCGATDYARATVVAQNAGALAAAVVADPWPVPPAVQRAFFTWFLRDGCLEPAQPDFAARAWSRLRQACPALPELS